MALTLDPAVTDPASDPTTPVAPPELATDQTAPEPSTEIPKVTKPVQDAAKVNRVRELFQRSRSWRQPLMTQWVRNYELVHNRAWSPRRRDDLPSPSPAEIYPIIRKIVAWLTDSAPAIEVVPAADPHSDTYISQWNIAADLRTSLRAAQHMNDWDQEFHKFFWDQGIYGIGILKTYWDQSRHQGLGDAMVKRVDPFSFYWDPDATDTRDAQWLIEVQEVNSDQLETRFPGACEVVGTASGVDEADRAPTLAGEPRGSQPKANPGPMAGAANEGYGLPGQTRYGRMGEADIDSDRHLILECWWQRVTPEGQRWWVTIICGNAVLKEVPGSDMWGHGEQPYERGVALDESEFVPMSMVELLTPLQKSINRILAAVENNIDLIGNPVLLEDVRAGLSRTAIVNRPGQRLPKNNGSEVRWLDPPQMHPQIAMQIVDFYVGEMERISGLSAIVRGATPTGRNSQGVLDSVQESAFVDIRMTLRNFEFMARRLGNKTAALIAEFYDEARVISFLGPTGEAMIRGLGKRHFYVPDRNSDSPSPIRFALHVKAGSTTPTSRQVRAAEADTLFAMGAIDGEAVLQEHDFPNWPNVAARMREVQAAQGTLGQPPGARAAAGRTT